MHVLINHVTMATHVLSNLKMDHTQVTPLAAMCTMERCVALMTLAQPRLHTPVTMGAVDQLLGTAAVGVTRLHPVEITPATSVR